MSDELEQTVEQLEQQVIDELNLEFLPEDNPNRMFSVVFAYQVRFLIPDNDEDHPPTEIIVNTHSQEYFSGRNEQDVRFQKEQTDRYSKEGLIKYIKEHIRDELWSLDPKDAHLTYTGKPEVREMTETELATFQMGRGNNDNE